MSGKLLVSGELLVSSLVLGLSPFFSVFVYLCFFV